MAVGTTFSGAIVATGLAVDVPAGVALATGGTDEGVGTNTTVGVAAGGAEVGVGVSGFGVEIGTAVGVKGVVVVISGRVEMAGIFSGVDLARGVEVGGMPTAMGPGSVSTSNGPGVEDSTVATAGN